MPTNPASLKKFLTCPACQRPLHRFKAGTVTLDGCDGGCGGIWFDHRELEKVDREFAHAADKIADIFHDPDVKVDDYAVRSCPRCAGVTLDKKLYSLGSGVIMDRCLKCKGVWLDNGELEKIQAALHPHPAPVRSAAPQSVAINLALVQQIQILHLGPQA